MKASRLILPFFLVAILLASSVAVKAAVQPVTKQEGAVLMRWLTPLPHEIKIERQALVPADQIHLTLSPNAGSLEQAAAAELAEIFTQKTGQKPTIDAQGCGSAAFEILLGCCDKDGKLAGRKIPDTARLFTLANADQAYRIVPLNERTLALVGAQPHGVYYAAKTLKQLLAAMPKSAQGQTAIPLADVTDWPDLPERGLWGGNADEELEWMADRKMNLLELHARVSLDANGRGVATMPAKLLENAKRHGIKVVAIISHLEQLSSEIFVRYPQLKAVGDYALWRRTDPHASPICFAQPEAERILADWLTCLAKTPNVSDVNVWLSEEDVSCQCEKCKPLNPFAQQTQVVLRAWQTAKKANPHLRLRILLTQGSYKSNGAVLAVAPPEVGITYYSGITTYDSSRKPMIYPLLEEFAGKGRWLGCYPQLTASWRIVAPWTAPQFIKARMEEFVAKRLQCLCGYATPSNRFYDFNVTAAAEWSWNVQGRSERDFAVSWATRQGLAQPEKFADWAMLLGPVGWDVHGSNAMLFWIYNGVSDLFKDTPPKLGEQMFAYFPTKEHFDADLAICDRAMKIAREMQLPEAIAETQVTRGLVEMLKSVYLEAEALKAGKKLTAEQRQQAAAALAAMDQGAEQARAGLLAWAQAVAPQLVPPQGFSGRFADTVQCLDKIVGEASEAAVAHGVPDSGRAYRIRSIGDWKIADFKNKQTQQKCWSVDDSITGPGRYEVVFLRDNRDLEARIKQVRLISSRSSDAAAPTVLATDAHSATASGQPNNSYFVTLDKYDPKLHYFIVVELEGKPADYPTQNTEPVGHATIQKLRAAD